MDEALVENAQDDIDDHDREQQQECKTLLARLKCLRRSGESGADRRRQRLPRRFLDFIHRRAEGNTGRVIE